REALLRALLYIRMPDGLVDERGFNFLRHTRQDAGRGLTLAAFKKLVREQFFMLLLDERRAVEAIPDMVARDPDLASRNAVNVRRMIDMVGLRTSLAKARLAEIEELMKGKGLSVERGTSDREKRQTDTIRPVRPHAAARSKHN